MGKVYLIGAGPGDPGLMTVKGINILRKADAIVYDRLASPELLDENKDALKIYCGKAAGHHSMTQDETNEKLYELSKDYNIVVRLKGGDPYVFGRGGEEAVYLKDRDVEFEVIPGITSGIGGFAYAGVPVSYREIATSIHLITGHLKGAEAIDFTQYAKLPGTLVFYMGVANIKAIAKGLIKGGMDSSTPLMVLYNATLPDQESHLLTLGEVVEMEDMSRFKTPSLILVGEVAKFSEKINYLDFLPLHKKRIVITRSRAQSKRTVDMFRELGAEVLSVPTIKTELIEDFDLESLLNNITTGIIAFSSANGVNYFMDLLLRKQDLRALGPYRIASIGKETTRTLKTYNISPDIEAVNSTSEGFSKEIQNNSTDGENLIIIRPEDSRGVISNICSENLNCTEAIIYRTVPEELDLGSLSELKEGFDFICFTSSSTVHHLMEGIEKSYLNKLEKDLLLKEISKKSVSIGPITSKTLKKYNIKPCIESPESSVESMVRSICEGVNINV